MIAAFTYSYHDLKTTMWLINLLRRLKIQRSTMKVFDDASLALYVYRVRSKL